MFVRYQIKRGHPTPPACPDGGGGWGGLPRAVTSSLLGQKIGLLDLPRLAPSTIAAGPALSGLARVVALVVLAKGEPSGPCLG